MTCINCNQVFVLINKRGPAPKYCSNECRRNYWRNHKDLKTKNEKALYKFVCKQCGKKFEAYGDKERLFCSRACFGKCNRTLIGTTRKCEVCGNLFEPGYKNQKCCSESCAHKKQWSEKQKTVSLICEHCGLEFKVYNNCRSSAKYCSSTCKNAYNNHVKRARKRNANIEKVFPYKVYERDGWICQLCGKKVDKKIHYPNFMCASLDHVIPISKGGTHETNNVQLAHLICNIRKGTKEGECNGSKRTG